MLGVRRDAREGPRLEQLATWANLSSGIVWATDHGARVVNISIIGSSGGTTLYEAVRHAHARGVVVVASAGNNGDTALGYPAAYDEVVSVAGSDSADRRATWSTYGSWVDVAAPGCNQATTRSGGYGSFCGTSSAAPVVAGVAALLASHRPDASNAAIASALASTAVPVGAWVRWGRIDAAAALAALGSGSPPPTEPAPAPAPTTVTDTFSGSLTAKAPSRSFAVTSGAGALAADLSFTKAPSLTLTLRDASGAVVASSSGASVLHSPPRCWRAPAR